MKKVLVILAVIIIGIGACNMMNSGPSKEEMIEVLKSDEAIKIIEKSLKNLDDKALTPNGIIKNYKINYDTVNWNPMGGIVFKVYINEDDELYIDDIINKYNGNLENEGSALSSKLSDLLRGK